MSDPVVKPLDTLSILNALPGCLLVLLPDAPRFTVVGVTEAFLTTTSIKREEILGRGVFEIFIADSGNLNATGIKNLSASLLYVLKHKRSHHMADQSYDIVNPQTHQLERRIWHTLNTPVLDDKGDIQYIIHTIEDVTEKNRPQEAERKAHQKIEESEEKYRGLFESIDQGFCVLELIFDSNSQPIDYRFLETNPVFEKQTGLKEAVGKTARELVPNLESHWLELYGKVALTGEPIRFVEGSEAMGRWFDVYAFRMSEGISKKVALLFTDISNRRQSEESVRKSELNLRNMILQSPVAMCILRGPSFVVEIANDRMYELWGRRQEDLLNRPIFEGLPEAAEKGLEHLLSQVYTTGESYVGKAHPITVPRVGVPQTVYVDFVYHPFREADGSISGVISVATDVTEQVIIRKRGENNEAALQKRVNERTADLEEQKVFMGSILEASFDGIYALKAVRNREREITDFQYLFTNHNIAKQLNLEVSQIIGSSMLALIPENRNNGFFDLFCKLLVTGETFRGETHFVTKNIDSWYDYVIVPIDQETVVVSTKDITEKKLASIQLEEQRNLLDNILKNSSNGVSVSQVFRDEKGNAVDALTILANEAAIKYIGLPKDIYLSKRATEIEPNIISTPYYQACIQTLNTGEPFMIQYFMESTRRWLEVTVSKLDEDHLIHVFTDVTPIKEAQLQLERYVEDLKRSNQNLEEFAYAASHDLKEPMRKIQLFSNRLKDRLQDKLAQEDKNFFDRIMNATQRMNTLIDDLLMYSHVSRGVVIEEMVDLNQKVRLVLEDLELEIDEKEANVRVENLPTVKGHRKQLQQLFQNLISNAIKYSKPGVAPEVSISCRLVDGDETLHVLPGKENKRYYLIEVSDNGIGFEPDDAERIFNVFTRLHGMAEYKGTGVGLSIARKVAENHAGFLWAEGKPDGGASFKVMLPAE